ncbi:MAG: hypothetical protein KDE27_26395, partial [Planctomycetes bacterium]|nr:hypothetical protein [Planctomycetota bacterium]
MTNLDRSPYRFGGWSPTALPLLWLWFPVMFSGSRWHDGWAAAIQLAVVLVGLGITFYVVLRPNFGSGTFAAMRRLHRRLPWFEAMPVTAHAEVGRADFAATLANHGFGIIDLDG